jgi:hypothetical protein
MQAAATRLPTLGHVGPRAFLEAIMTSRQLESSSTRGLIQLASRLRPRPRARLGEDSGGALKSLLVIICCTVTLKAGQMWLFGKNQPYEYRNNRSVDLLVLLRPTGRSRRGLGMGRCNWWRIHGRKDFW